jgi:hypothetical protein
MTEENRTIDQFGPQCILETGSSKVGTCGVASFVFQAENDAKVKFNAGLYENGMASIEAEGKLQIQGGIKAKKGENSVALFAHKGDMSIQCISNGTWVKIKGPNIILDATNEVVIQARKIRLGYEKPGKCERLVSTAKEIDLGAPKHGNMAVVLKTESFMKAFDKSMIADKVASVAGASVGFGALENKATKILSKVSSLI